MPYLKPYLDQFAKDFAVNRQMASDLVEAFGSPLNVLFPQQVAENLADMEQVFKDRHVKGRVFYAAKSNKSDAILRQFSSISSASIDVASAGELKAALGAGISYDRIEATGPKSTEFLRLCILHDVIINIDDKSEYDRILSLSIKLGRQKKPRVLLRIARPHETSQTRRETRFGMKPEDIDAVLKDCKDNASIALLGFSFHLATTGRLEKAAMFETACMYAIKASEMGLSATVIDIGGGLAINYVESREEWGQYVASLKESLMDPQRDTMTWQNSGLGFWVEDGKIRGGANFSDFHSSQSPAEQLSGFFDVPMKKLGVTFGQFLSETGITVFVEPGRSLLEQAGVTVAKVLYRKRIESGEMLIVCDMNRSNLNSQDIEYMVDPIVLSEKKREKGKGFLVGNLCLPHDFLSRRQIYFDTLPDEDDLIVFPNTAGYLMDFAESSTLRQPIAKKIALKQLNNKQFNYYEDDKYPAI